LDPIPSSELKRRGRRAPGRLAWLATIRDRSRAAALGAWLEQHPVRLTRIASAWNLRDDELAALLEAVDAKVIAATALGSSRWLALREATLNAIAAAHEREPETPGVERQRLARIVAPAMDREVFGALIDELLGEQKLVRRGAFVALPTHTAELRREQRVQWERVKPLLMNQPFEPPRVRDIARQCGIAETEVRTLLKTVSRVGDITLVAHDHFFMTSAVADLADIAAEVAREHGAARASEFRDRIGTGRKLAIQILEFFDRAGYTRRVRDDHLIRRANPWRT
jgi:selenocysteine-specific elongation factor